MMTSTHDPEQLKLVVRQEQIALTHGYPENLAKLYAREFRARLVGTALVGQADVVESEYLAKVFGSAFANLVPMFLIQIAQGNSVASRFVLQGTFEHELFGIAPTHKPIRMHLNGIHHFNDEGKIREEYLYWDNLAWMQQIGAVPSPTGTVTLPTIQPPSQLWPGKSNKEAFHAAKVRLAYTAADAGAVDTFDQFYDPKFHGFESGGSSIEGVEAMRDRVRAFTSAVPNRKINVLETVAEGTMVATHIDMVGNFDRPLVQANGMTVQPTGAPMSIAGVEFYSFDEHGMILQSWPEFDVLDFLQQIGVIPKA